MAKKTDDSDVIYCTIVEAKNLAALDGGVSSDPYCIVKSSFNKQSFKTKVIKKVLTPKWDQQFSFFTSRPTGHIHVKVFDKNTLFDGKLGEVNIPLKGLENGEVVDDWYKLEGEPKKKKGAHASQKGEIHVKLHFPSGAKKKETLATPAGKSELSKSGPQGAAPAGHEKPKPKRFIDAYDKGKKLGSGGFSIVYECHRKGSGEGFAVKVIAKNQSEDELSLLQREIDIMKKLQHNNIISLQEVFDEEDNIYLVLELVTGGELFDQIVSRGTYTEADAANIIRQILEAIAYMHDHGVAHRDLKPENLLLALPNSNEIKITDFGLSKDFGEGVLQTSCGTPDYVAPEVLKGQPYDHSVDIWSIGVITYILLCGFPPFYGNTDAQIFDKILKCQFDFPSPDWDNVSEEAKQFVGAILTLDPHARPTAADCLEAPWLLNAAPAKKAINRMDSKLADYNAGRKKALAAAQNAKS